MLLLFIYIIYNLCFLLHVFSLSFQITASNFPQVQRINQFLQLTNQPQLQIDKQVTLNVDYQQQNYGRGRQENDTATESEVTTITIKNDKQFKLLELTDQPSTINGIMRPYQLEALQWLLDLHCYSNQYMIQMCKLNNINYNLSSNKFQYQVNAILAYEMGLGKTLIAISLISQLLLSYQYKYPFLVIVPKSTLPQWQDEFKKFNEKIKVYSVIGDQQTRKEQLNFVLKNKQQYQVILTTYDVLHIEINTFKQLTYEYIIFDEGHKLKNAETQISNDIMLLHTYHKLIMTGTPIQNDLNELHSLLYAIMPYLFSSAEQFVQIVQTDENQQNQNQNQQQNVELLQQILQHFILRRTKIDVEHLPKKTEFLITCPLTTLQKKLYRGILLKDSTVMQEALNKRNQNGEILKTSLNNIMMQLRKCADHPYLFKGVEPLPYVDGDHLINVSGKMVVMMKLLDYIVNQLNEKVLIFCQMTQLLNIISDTLTYKQMLYLRLDGSTSLEDRQKQLQLFSNENSQSYKIFLLSTRAGALGLNLTAANHLILFQSDLNPQVDLQAVGRLNRIGQKKPIFVYRLMSENTVDQRVYERAQIKLQLETLIMKNADFSGCKIQKKTNRQELMEMISAGGKELFDETDINTAEFDYNQPEIQFTDEGLQKMLAEGRESNEKIQQQVQEKEEKMYDVLKNLKQDGKLNELVDIQNLYEFQGENFKELTQRIMAQRRIEFENKYASKYMYNDEDDKKETNYLTVAKFKRTEFYKPEFYLLDDGFYMLQDKIFNEITTTIKTYFEKPENQQASYDDFILQMQQSDRKDIYVNGQCPGLNQEEFNIFYKYHDINCWPLNNQPLTRVAFNTIIDTLFLDRLDEQLKLHYGIQRIVPSNKVQLLQTIGQQAQFFTNDAEQQQKSSFELLLPNQNWFIAPLKQIKIDTFDNIDYEFHYERFKANGYPNFNASAKQLEDFCKSYFQAYPDSESTQKVKRGMDRLESITLKYKVLSDCIQQNINNGCEPNQLLYQLDYGKIYNLLGSGFNNLADRFLLLFTNIFGGGYFEIAQQIIRILPCFSLDFNLKSKTAEELKDRAERILKAMVKKYKQMNINIKQSEK